MHGASRWMWIGHPMPVPTKEGPFTAASVRPAPEARVRGASTKASFLRSVVRRPKAAAEGCELRVRSTGEIS